MNPPPPKPSIPEPYAAGAVIGTKYRLERLLGQGGMGSVWEAKNVALEVAVAIKLIRTEIERSDMNERLLQEARAVARLGHPAIVRVFDVGQTERGEPFIVMELLEGQSLSELLRNEHRLSSIEAVRMLLPIADALSAAHAKGIIHRDIKPDNVFLAREAGELRPKLVDFGIAKLEHRDVASKLTQKGDLVGSPDYMSPEQARGDDDIDQRSDVWAFCVMLYEAITGTPPFDGPNYHALLRAIIEEHPRSLVDLRAADAELSAIVEKGLSKARSDRFQSMQELGASLARWLFGQGVFEDVSGTSIDARWLSRRSDSGGRFSRATMESLSGVTPNRFDTTSRQVSSNAPTSVASVVVKARSKPGRASLFALSLVALTGVVLAAWLLRPTSAESKGTTPAAVEAEPVARPAAEVPALGGPAPEVPSGNSAPSLTSVPASAEPEKPAPSAPRRPVRPATPSKQAGKGSPGSPPKLDLMTPY